VRVIGLHRHLRPSVSAGRGRTAFLFRAAKALQRWRKKVGRRRCRKAITLRSDQAMRGSVARARVTGSQGKIWRTLRAFRQSRALRARAKRDAMTCKKDGLRIVPEIDRDGARAPALCLSWPCRNGAGWSNNSGGCRTISARFTAEGNRPCPGPVCSAVKNARVYRVLIADAASQAKADPSRPREPG
jgi:hypothetical protein